MVEKLPKPQVRILTELARYRWLTHKQFYRLGMTPSYVREHTFALIDDKKANPEGTGHITRTFLKHVQHNGYSPFWYTLTEKGIRYLSSIGQSTDGVIRKTGPEEHTIGLVDTMIAARLFGESETAKEAGIVVETITGEYSLKQHPRQVEIDTTLGGHHLRERVGIVPDALITIQAQGEVWDLFLEYDRDTEHQTKWVRKLKAYVALAETETVGMVIVPVASTVDAEKRLKELLRWTEGELSKTQLDLQDLREFGEIFRFTTADPATMEPSEFFLGHHWRQPFETEPRAFL